MGNGFRTWDLALLLKKSEPDCSIGHGSCLGKLELARLRDSIGSLLRNKGLKGILLDSSAAEATAPLYRLPGRGFRVGLRYGPPTSGLRPRMKSQQLTAAAQSLVAQ